MSSGAYFLFEKNIKEHSVQDRKILFYKIQLETDAFLSKLMYRYSMQKSKLLQKYLLVHKYLEETHENPLNINLQEIDNRINEKEKDDSYNIYITDANLVIRNTTFKSDDGFDLSFMKPQYDANFKKGVVEVSTPVFEKSSKSFLSYAESYFVDERGAKTGVLQVSYSYKNSAKDLLDINKVMTTYPDIVDAKAYILVDSGFINDIILKDFSAYKPNLQEILEKIKSGKLLKKRLRNRELLMRTVTIDSEKYIEMDIASKSAIFDDTSIIYTLTLNTQKEQESLNRLNTVMLFIVGLSFLAIIIVLRLRRKEIRFSEQDKFVQSSMHEIKTPLSIIMLNNELRELEFGVDEYSSEIKSAIKVLKTSYDDMSYTITKDELTYSKEILKLERVVKDRVEYFKGIAKSKGKSIVVSIDSECYVMFSMVELVRLIDNNLSNAIKYSAVGSEISVTLKANRLFVHNSGEPIKNLKSVFNKYVRENSVVGGHGLGLNIVKNITQKYMVKIVITSSKENGTKFEYIFKCHTDDMSKR